MEDQMDVSVESTPVELDRSMSDVEETPTLVTDYEAFASKILPDLGYEVADFQHNTWHIASWKSLDRRITGPEFEAGGWKWRILLFPAGNNTNDTVSIYLDFADPKGAPQGWHSCVQFGLVLWNDPAEYVEHTANHRFTADESDWGFTRFYEMRKLFVSTDNRARPLIENDSTNITAFVRVLKDPTGVLWHNFIKYLNSFLSFIRSLNPNCLLWAIPSLFLALLLTSAYSYDSKKETGYVGLKNQGATCYMNSLLQSLYCTNYFRKAVYQIPTVNDEPIKSVSLALQRVFYQLQTSDTPVGTTELTKSFGWDSLESFMQHDVQELNRKLQENLEGKMKNTEVDGAITKLFLGKTKSYIKCVNVEFESSRVEDYYDLSLDVKGFKTLRDSFKYIIQEETLEGENRYMAEGFGLQDAKKGVIFESFPPVLHLHLKRFDYDIQRSASVKINDRYEFPMEIDLEEYLSPEADRTKPQKYLLHGVLVHSGDFHGGHYFALIKPEKDGKWLKFDDDRVTPVTDREVLEDNYGGEINNSNPHPIRPAVRNLKRFTNAYMLVYIREFDIDEILAPVRPEDIPPHLQKRLDDEKAAAEQKKKEREEMHLYLNVKIISDEAFRTHQGFDLANFEERQYPFSDIPTMKVLKAESYGTFREKIAEQHNVPVEATRLWVLVNRQNKTVRPDAPINENMYSLSMEEIFAKMASRQNDLKLYLEIAEKPTNGKYFPSEGNAFTMVFLKYFDPDNQTLEGLGHLYIQKFGKVGDILQTLCEKKGFPLNTPLKLYEEIKPTMIEEMKTKATFQQSEIQDGDIICFTKALTEKEIQDHQAENRIATIPQFYEYLTCRIVVQFKPKFRDRELKPEFELVLNKKWNYDEVAAKVAEHLETDPLKLRFTTATSGNSNSGPKTIVKRTTSQSLSDMLQPGYLGPPTNLLFYEMLDISIVELETKKFLKVIWLGTTIKEENTIDIRLPKNAHISEVIEELLLKVKLSEENKKIRLCEVVNNKISKELVESDPIANIQDFVSLYAEEIPDEEIQCGPEDRIVQVYHFTKEPLRTHGIPFKFLIKAGEPFSETKNRLQARLGMNEKDFAKIKFAIVPPTSYSKPRPILEEETLSELSWNSDDLLGLDHVDRSGRSTRMGGLEKAIFIRG
ncbi:8105_t:CDS:10 [Ambispora gerdemannii]|uniref:ubiquitinyl hydrolase 1 n=1 Tax=Ambispora gerdemannii TaxID=144530 RepID=A0A9N8V083_9GLOM|nr:8105_t:CDS:10 [Ambispora gerdemannii]